jgi:hypothetical protein
VPHAFGAHGGPAEIIAILGPDGERPTYDAEAGPHAAITHRGRTAFEGER